MTALDWFLLASVFWQSYRISTAARRITALENRLKPLPTIEQLGQPPWQRT